MRLRPTPPTIPAEFTSRLSEPEQAFGPNLKFRAIAVICGLVCVIMGVVLFLVGLGAQVPLADWVGGKVATPLVVFGAVILFGVRVPRNWVFVCPGGVIRKRGDLWESVCWDEVMRFEDASLGKTGVAIRQCRLLLADGNEWGFLADFVADYSRLAKTLAQRTGQRNQLNEADGQIVTR
jgi:hypothetical protein